ncbi:MAG: cyclase family protein [Novosphingobium sp.]|nr:cyclase family protein [Novosphingobium sp.]
MSEISGNGRFGPADERGAANLVDGAATLRGIAAAGRGRVVTLAVPIASNDRGAAAEMRAPPQHFMTRDGGDYAAGLAERAGYGFADDVIVLPTHGTTHIDALAHVWRDGIMYNGFSAATVTSRGAARCGIDKLGAIVTRALFVDFASDDDGDPTRAITSRDLQQKIAANGIVPEPGDALLVRTGWLKAWREGNADKHKTAGLHHDCADWIVKSGIALVAADNIAVEVIPSRDPQCAMPLHIAVTRDQGVYLAELLDLENLAGPAPACVMLVIAPLAIRGGVGSPITPVAIF